MKHILAIACALGLLAGCGGGDDHHDPDVAASAPAPVATIPPVQPVSHIPTPPHCSASAASDEGWEWQGKEVCHDDKTQ